MSIFVLRLLFVLHLLFPFFQILFFKFFNKNLYLKSNAVQIDSFLTFGGKKFQWKQIVAELAGIFVVCSFKFISRLQDYHKIYKKN